MEQLANKQAVINYIGKNTVVKFSAYLDGVMHYEMVVPKTINDEYYIMRIEVFHNEEPFMDFETIEDLTHKRQVFELHRAEYPFGESECLYHEKYIDPKNN